MTYYDFIDKAIRLTIINEEDGEAYLIPWYRKILHDSELKLEDVEDYQIESWDEVYESLHLSVRMINQWPNEIYKLCERVNRFLDNDVKNTMTEEETKITSDFMEYMRLNKENEEKKKELEELGENAAELKSEKKENLFQRVVFSKKKI